ncbi:MAG: protein kinase, partial [Planctomycetales bacterium]|nr:protein kinase [Planctomycetales bacterium]
MSRATSNDASGNSTSVKATALGSGATAGVTVDAAEVPLIEEHIDQLIEQYEAARSAGDLRALREFVPPPHTPGYERILAELIRVDLEWSWGQGREVGLDEYDRTLPKPLVDSGLRSEAAYEEYRLRIAHGSAVEADEFARRYAVDVSSWPSCADLQRAMRQSAADSGPIRAEECRFPELGERFAGFTLESELGRGAFARVYLARQDELASRRVALKLTPSQSLEPQHLARLQHANIVPIYSWHRDERELSAVCMPYLGRRTLEDLLVTVRREPAPASQRILPPGQNLISTFVCRDDPTIDGKTPCTVGPASSPAQQTNHQLPEAASVVPALAETLRGASYVEAAVWVASQLVAGLAHAHARGIVHRDVKPA